MRFVSERMLDLWDWKVALAGVATSLLIRDTYCYLRLLLTWGGVVVWL
jgi:hypothetical protein